MRLRLLVLLTALVFFPSCTIVRVDRSTGGPGVEFDGVIEGHAVAGWLENDTPLRISVLEGSQSGSVLEFVLWKLLRLEVGLAGLSIGVGPLHAGVGVLWYDADAPDLERKTDADADADADETVRDETVRDED